MGALTPRQGSLNSRLQREGHLSSYSLLIAGDDVGVLEGLKETLTMGAGPPVIWKDADFGIKEVDDARSRLAALQKGA